MAATGYNMRDIRPASSTNLNGHTAYQLSLDFRTSKKSVMPEHPDSTSQSSHGGASSALTNTPSMSGSERTARSQTGAIADQNTLATSIVQEVFSLLSMLETDGTDATALRAMISRQAFNQYDADGLLQHLDHLKVQIQAEGEQHGLPSEETQRLYEEGKKDTKVYPERGPKPHRTKEKEGLPATQRPEPPKTESAPLFFNPDGC
jgi:hypothetical protein